MRCQEKESSSGLMVETLKESSKVVLCMAWACRPGRMDDGMKETTVSIRSTEKELIRTRMEVSIVVSGSMDYNTELEAL